MRDLLMAAAIVALMLFAVGLARANDIDQSLAEQAQADEAFALMLAQITANERSLAHARPADMAVIYQTTRAHGSSSATRMAFLRRHSNCVFGTVPPEERAEDDQPPEGSNCWWSWHLRNNDEEPKNFTADWSRYQERWREMREYARGLVAGRTPRGGWPCDVDPDTWGGRMDRARALERGMIPLSCRSSRNEGYLYAHNADRLSRR